jgi:hypothetical protein
MKLSTPDDDPGREVEQSDDDGAEKPSMPVVEDDVAERLDIGPMPVDQVVRAHGTMLDSALDRIDELEDRAEELEEENEELRETVDRLGRVMGNIVAEVSSDYVSSHCDDCGGELTEKTPAWGEHRIQCTDCEDVKAVKQ